MGGFGHLALHIEPKHGFGRARSLLGEAEPSRIADSSGALPVGSIANELHVHVVGISRPVPIKVVEKRWPVMWQMISLEILDGKREAMIEAHQCRDWFVELLEEPGSEAAPGPIFLGARRRRDFGGGRSGRGTIDAQAFQAGVWSRCTGIVDAEIAVKHGASGACS